MTRRELREHCFKMLFSVDFYTTGEEAKAQMQQYFQSPEEDDTAEDGSLQVVHKVAAGEKDREMHFVLHRVVFIHRCAASWAQVSRSSRLDMVLSYMQPVLRSVLYVIDQFMADFWQRDVLPHNKSDVKGNRIRHWTGYKLWIGITERQKRSLIYKTDIVSIFHHIKHADHLFMKG